jgi:hypothetical protein
MFSAYLVQKSSARYPTLNASLICRTCTSIESIACCIAFTRRSVNNGFSEAVHEQFDFFVMKKFLLHWFFTGAALAGMAGCAQVKKPPAQVKAAAVGSRFDQVGLVRLYAGEPCMSQIMFDFHGAGSTVWLAAPRSETEILSDAAKKERPVHILGKWRRGGQSNCSYVEVTSAELTR